MGRLDSPLVKRLYDQPAFPEEELVIIATRAFPHRITKGYGMMAFGVVTHLNDQEVNNLRHFAELICACENEFIKLTMAGKSELLVFRRSEMAASTEEILTNEGIRFQSSPELRDLWK
jgi:PDZ domain